MINWEKISPIFKGLWKQKDSPKTSLSFEAKKLITRHLWLWKIGICTTNLRVYGRVTIHGKEMEARSKNFVLIKRGTAIRVVEMENSTLVVEPLSGCPTFWAA